LIGNIFLSAEKGLSNVKRNVPKGKEYLTKALELEDAEAGLDSADFNYSDSGHVARAVPF